MSDSDYTHGNSIYLTFFRNHLTGQRQRFIDRRGSGRLAWRMVPGGDSFIGNVLGRQANGRMAYEVRP